MDVEPFAVRLAQARERWASRQGGGPVDDQAFGRALGYTSSGSVSSLKNTIKPPPYDRILVIAKVTGTDPGWLAFGADCQAKMEKDWGRRGSVTPDVEAVPSPRPTPAKKAASGGRKRG